jgi:hypothetical protein
MNKIGFWLAGLVVLVGAFFIANWILSINELPDWKFTNDESLAAAAKAAGFQPSADVIGSVDNISRIEPGKVRVTGWAADLSGDGAPISLMVFVNGHGAAFSSTDGPRPDVTTAIKTNPKATSDATKNTAFVSNFSCAADDKIVVVAITKAKGYGPLTLNQSVCP